MKSIRLLHWFLLALFVPVPLSAQVAGGGTPVITLDAPNTYRLATSTDSALSYQLEVTEDLGNPAGWIVLEDLPMPGDGDVLSQRIIIPTGAAKLFFRYRVRPRTAADGAFRDWDKFYYYQSYSLTDSDGDGIPDVLETALRSDPADYYSQPYKVTSVDPFDGQAGHARDRAVVVYLNKPLPVTVASAKKAFVRHVAYTLGAGFDVDESVGGSTMILPGRKAVAFLPSPNLVAGANNTAGNNYRIYFGTDRTGIAGLMPFQSEFATVDYFDIVGSWVTSVQPGETAFEVATDFAPVIGWSQPLLPASLLSPDVTVVEQASGNPVTVTVSFDYDTNRMTLAHAAPFLPDAIYTVTLGTGFTNLMGKPLLNPFVWSFHTRPLRPVPVAGQGPFVQTVVPADFSTNVSLINFYDVTLTFSEAMVPSRFTAAHVHLRKHGATSDMNAMFAYDAATKRLTVTSLTAYEWGSRYELTLDSGAIYTVASPSKVLQGQSLFVFTTAPNPSISGGGSGGGTGGGGTAGGTSNGAAGSQDPEKPKPLILALTYGDPESGEIGVPQPDAGATLSLSITLPDGSQREQEFPNATNEYAYHSSQEIPPGSTVIVTPKFLKGNDSDIGEEMQEVQGEVSGLQIPDDANYFVFKQSGSAASAVSGLSSWQFLGPLASGPFVAQVQNAEKLKFGPMGMSIYNGGFPNRLVPFAKHFTPGAFTVANQNDTDGNGDPETNTGIDKDQSPVPGEVDLINLDLFAMPAILGKIKLTVKRGAEKVKLWAGRQKTTAIPLGGDNGVYFDIPAGGKFLKYVGVECIAPSQAPRDIEIWMGYEDADHVLDDGIDKVQITAVWAQLTPNGLVNAGNGLPPAWNMADAKAAATFQNILDSRFGTFDAQAAHGWFSHAIGFEFQVKPDGIGNEPGVKFDISRQKESMAWILRSGVWERAEADQNYLTPDIPNDDKDNDDEDDQPKNNHIYSLDNVATGPPADPTVSRVIQRGNFREFVRVRFDGKKFDNVNFRLEGSRCSDFVKWQMQEDLNQINGNWGHTLGGLMGLGGGHTPLGTHP